jgi:carbonic anhydrase/acetyltransferase-like protein (isoleucine patch superfamily)
MLGLLFDLYISFSIHLKTNLLNIKTNLMEADYRNLFDEEIGQLVHQGCSSTDWNLVKVSPDFIPDNIQNCKFSGHISLNSFNGTVNLVGGITFKTGIYNAWLHNCEVGKNALIHNVRSYIANYKIEEGVVIHNITTLAVDGESTFGNGVQVEAINEGGGRDIPIYDYLSAHVAYIMSLYRHRPKLVAALKSMVYDYTNFVKSTEGVIGAGTKILNCNTVLNVKTGPGTIIDGAKKLKNGTINSNFEAPVTIGEGVIMENFIVSSGTKITDATLVSKCFIGQGCVLDKHYSAENSLFFANCQGFHGEACSIFAGPYTVTHHKSTLLIAGMFSFLNAGSGSNQSNHMYKLGPIHQGIMERGGKTTSDSYLLWPSRIGAFTLVMGRHYKHCDTTDFPFSYLIESKDESILVPAINLKSIGTIRDTQKWPGRDNRTDSNLLDFINFNLLSPYTIHKMMNGRKKLLAIRESSGSSASSYSYDKMKIDSRALDRGIALYEMASWKFLGNSLITRLQNGKFRNDSDIQKALEPDTPFGKGYWVDLSGLICPYEALDKLLGSIENGELSSLEEVNSALAVIHKNYYNYEWTWAADAFTDFYGKSITEFTAADVIAVVEKWKKSVLDMDRFLYEDARKEFSMSKMIGFGVDGTNGAREEDFAQVRGEFVNNKTVVAICEHMDKKEKLGNEIIAMMQQTMTKVEMVN